MSLKEDNKNSILSASQEGLEDLKQIAADSSKYLSKTAQEFLEKYNKENLPEEVIEVCKKLAKAGDVNKEIVDKINGVPNINAVSYEELKQKASDVSKHLSNTAQEFLNSREKWNKSMKKMHQNGDDKLIEMPELENDVLNEE